MTVYCTNAPSPHETSRLPGFPAGVFSEQMVLLSEAAFFLAGGTVMAQQLRVPKAGVGPSLERAFWQEWGWIIAGAAAYQESKGPQDRNKAQQAGHNLFLQQHIWTFSLF